MNTFAVDYNIICVQGTKEMQSAFCHAIIHTIDDMDTVTLHYVLNCPNYIVSIP